MKRLVLIDSHALIHRAYHAVPPLTSPQGEPVNAVYGFTSILLRILRELQPDYLVAAYDLPGPTFRHTAFEQYKSQRAETPEELSGQFSKVKEILEAFKIPVFQKEGYEADDIIGTIARLTEKNKDLEVIVVTGDMDTLQLIRPRLKICSMKNQSEEVRYFDEWAVKERYGLTPRQMIDFKGLRGDASDNIPGVKGIGEIGALALLKHFGSLEKIYQNLREKNFHWPKNLSSSLAEKLKTGREAAEFSRELARIKTDVPLNFNLENAAYQNDRGPEIIEIFQKFGFQSLIKRLNIGGGIPALSASEKTSAAKLKQAQFFGLGEKSNKAKKSPGLEKGELSGFLLKEVEKPLTLILREMEKEGILVDTNFLKKLSVETNCKIKRITADIYQMAGEEFNLNSTRELSRILFEKLKISPHGLRRTEKSGVVSTSASELEKLKKQHPVISEILNYRELAKLKSTYIDALPVLVSLKDGRIHTTFDQFGASTGRLSSSNPNLQNIPIMSEYGREIRKAFVARKGFLLISFDYSQVELRVAAHLADDRKMIEAFLKGEDIHRLTASEVYNLPPERVTPDLRRAAKTLNFGVLYGMGASAFAEATGLPRTEAKRFIDEYFRDFSGIKKYMEEIRKFALEHGYVQTFFGRKRFIPEIYSQSWKFKRDAERMAVNMPIQGTAADLIKIAMVKIDEYLRKHDLKEEVKMLLQVHDELVLETKKELVLKVAPVVKNIMENVAKLKVPLEVEIKAGRSWGEQREVNSN